jgi:hypothetical protein
MLGVTVGRTLLEALRRGAFDWVAAEAAGIHRRTFYRWLERGEAGEEPYAQFAREVQRARAQARVEAEAKVRELNPLAWLRQGPGRERNGRPGWTAPARVALADEPITAGPEDEGIEALLAKVLEEIDAEEGREGEAR